MARFIIVHKLPAMATQDEVITAGKAVVAASSNGSKWLRSWVVPEGDRFFCERHCCATGGKGQKRGPSKRL
jgi:hypothetical protein